MASESDDRVAENVHVKESEYSHFGMEESQSSLMQDQIEESSSISDTVISSESLQKVLYTLQCGNGASKWRDTSFITFQEIMNDKDAICARFTKQELLICYDTFDKLSVCIGFRVCKSWNKKKIADIIHQACTKPEVQSAPAKQRKRKNPATLIFLCKKVIKAFPKKLLNAVVAEHEFPERVDEWRQKSPFATPTLLLDDCEMIWFSMPEYNYSNVAYIFSMLDVHHLYTNCRIKVCKDGFPQRGISKIAWLDVAKANRTNLKISHVEDLVDKQSDAIARLTFSTEVELEMERLNYRNESAFCRLMREYHEAEDEPGIVASERCRRRLHLRKWLLEDVNFGTFPPFGSHIKGIPNIMFQGYITNIERRIQLFPYVKSGHYNVRALGSLEAENFFGEFHDMDPKGSGVIKAEDIPAALESACQMNHTRLSPGRPFHMTLSKAKVYPLNQLLDDYEMDAEQPYFYPMSLNKVEMRDHMFDHDTRGKRKVRRKLASIAGPMEAARGVAPVRQHHKCDESKILAHKRLGIQLD